MQVAWIKKAPPAVQKGAKTDMILVHYFDGWADVHNTPSKWAYGWLPASKIKDFEGGFQSLAKSKTGKMFIEQVLVRVCKTRSHACLLEFSRINCFH
jgi:hypothetical protein